MNIIIVSASTRTGRQTHKAALALEKKINTTPDARAEILDLKEANLPLFEDVMQMDASPENPINKAFTFLDKADALIFVTPEYNGSYSSALKNLVDFYPKKTFANKAVGTVSITTGVLGGMRAALQLQQLILALWAIPCPHMLLIPAVHTKFDEMGNIIDSSFEKNIDTFLSEFLWLASALKTAK